MGMNTSTKIKTTWPEQDKSDSSSSTKSSKSSDSGSKTHLSHSPNSNPSPIISRTPPPYPITWESASLKLLAMEGLTLPSLPEFLLLPPGIPYANGARADKGKGKEAEHEEVSPSLPELEGCLSDYSVHSEAPFDIEIDSSKHKSKSRVPSPLSHDPTSSPSPDSGRFSRAYLPPSCDTDSDASGSSHHSPKSPRRSSSISPSKEHFCCSGHQPLPNSINGDRWMKPEGVDLIWPYPTVFAENLETTPPPILSYRPQISQHSARTIAPDSGHRNAFTSVDSEKDLDRKIPHVPLVVRRFFGDVYATSVRLDGLPPGILKMIWVSHGSGDEDREMSEEEVVYEMKLPPPNKPGMPWYPHPKPGPYKPK